MGFILSSLMWLIVLIIAFSNIEKGYKMLEPFMRMSRMQELLPAAASDKVPIVLAPIKSVNYVASTLEEQRELLRFEEILTGLKPVATVIPTASAIDTEEERWYQATHPPLAELSESTMREVSKMIMCANNQIEHCEGVKELVEGGLFGLKTNKRIIFGFRMKLEAPNPCSAAAFRIKLHKSFHKRFWPAIMKVIDFSNEDREIIFVGYESGGSLASLAAWQCLKQFDQYNPPGTIVSNGNNQVKVITWDEVPLFTIRTAQVYPVLARNHFHYSTKSISESKIRTILQFSGGIDEINYFTINAEEIKMKSSYYADFSARICNKIVDDDDPNAWNPLLNLALFLKKKVFEELEPDRLDKLKDILKLHRDHLSIIESVLLNTFRPLLLGTKLAEPSACADSLANQLSSTIFTANAVEINCRPDNFDVINGTFKIFCEYKTTADSSKAQFLSFDAVLGDDTIHEAGSDCHAFMEEVEIEDPNEAEKKSEKKKKNPEEKPKMIKARRYSGLAPVVNEWSNCFYELFDQYAHISPLLSPYKKVGKKNYPNCTYIPFEDSSLASLAAASAFSKSARNTGCYLRASEVTRELRQVHSSDPAFFYSAISSNLKSFPTRCFKLLFHISFKVDERPGLPALQQVSVEYLTQLIGNNPLKKTEVTLWTPRDTESYKTLAYFGTDDIDASALADRTFYKHDFENSIVKCLSNSSFPYRDCTSDVNRWVPGACPIACSRTHGAINFLCRQVKSCLNAGYYVSVSQEGRPEELSQIKDTLMEHPHPQFGLFHVQTKKKGPLSAYYSNVNFNVALFRIPIQ